jgi:CRISPR/Cas system endoribonuclease Cas6 (RAMP superfamily)
MKYNYNYLIASLTYWLYQQILYIFSKASISPSENFKGFAWQVFLLSDQFNDNKKNKWISTGWLLFNVKWMICSLSHDANKLHSDDMMRSTLYKINTLNWIFIVLIQWNNSP